MAAVPPHLLLVELHGTALRLLAGATHYSGLQVAAKHHLRAGTISLGMYRRLSRLDLAYHVTRHITLGMVNGMLGELAQALEVHGSQAMRSAAVASGLEAELPFEVFVSAPLKVKEQSLAGPRDACVSMSSPAVDACCADVVPFSVEGEGFEVQKHAAEKEVDADPKPRGMVSPGVGAPEAGAAVHSSVLAEGDALSLPFVGVDDFGVVRKDPNLGVIVGTLDTFLQVGMEDEALRFYRTMVKRATPDVDPARVPLHDWLRWLKGNGF